MATSTPSTPAMWAPCELKGPEALNFNSQPVLPSWKLSEGEEVCICLDWGVNLGACGRPQQERGPSIRSTGSPHGKWWLDAGPLCLPVRLLACPQCLEAPGRMAFCS